MELLIISAFYQTICGQSIYSPEKPKDTTNDELVESKPKKGKRGARPLSNYDKKAIDYIQQTTNSKFTQARGMYLRIKRKNIDYQTVDWDSIQGKDLKYKDQLQRLEKMVGKTYQKGQRYSNIKWQEEKYNSQRNNQGWG